MLDVNFNRREIAIKYDKVCVDTEGRRIVVWVGGKCIDLPNVRAAAAFLRANTYCVAQRVAEAINREAFKASKDATMFSRAFCCAFATNAGANDGSLSTREARCISPWVLMSLQNLCALFGVDYEEEKDTFAGLYLDGHSGARRPWRALPPPTRTQAHVR